MTAKMAPWSMGLGFLALAGALFWAFLARSLETRQLDGEVRSIRAELGRAQGAQASLEAEVTSSQRRLDLTRRDSNDAEAEVQSVLIFEPRLAADFDALLGDINGRIAGLEAEIENARRAVEAAPPPPLPSPSPEPARPESAEGRGVRRVESSPRDLAQRFERFQASIALVISSGNQFATGQVLWAKDDKVYILTVSDAVPHGAEVKVLLRSSAEGDQKFQVVPSEVVYRRERFPLLLLECSSSRFSEFAALAHSNFEGNSPKKGDAVYAIGAQAVGISAFTGSVFEGIVSSLEEASNGDPPVIRVTLPMNEGSRGSLVVTADGQVAGILWQAARGLDRMSAALPAAAVKPVIERLRRNALAAMAGADPGGGGGAAKDHPRESSIDLGGPLDPEAEVFAGPDELVLIWEREPGRLRAFRSGSASPVWEIGGDTWSSLAYRPWQPFGFLSKTRPPISVALNLRSGKPGSTLSGRLNGYISRAWAAFPIGNSHVLALQQGIAIANLESGRVFDLAGIQATMLGQVEDLLTLTTIRGEIGWVTRGEFLAICARIDSLHLEIEKLWREKMPDTVRAAEVFKREQQIRLLVEQLGRGVKLFSGPESLVRDLSRPGRGFCHVPGSYTHIIGREVWQIGPERVTRMGRLEPLWHSDADGSWARIGHSAGAQPCAMASPDGRYAVTATHLHDLEELKAVAELPFPTGPAGFTSKGKTIYAYDRKLERLVFLRLEDVLRGNSNPPAAAR